MKKINCENILTTRKILQKNYISGIYRVYYLFAYLLLFWLQWNVFDVMHKSLPRLAPNLHCLRLCHVMTISWDMTRGRRRIILTLFSHYLEFDLQNSKQYCGYVCMRIYINFLDVMYRIPLDQSVAVLHFIWLLRW